MLILGLRLEIFYFSSYGYCETSLFQCHFITFVDKVIELFQGGLDNKRNVSFFMHSGEYLSPSCNFKFCHLIFPNSVLRAKSGDKQTQVLAKAAELYKLSVFYSRRQAHLSLTRSFKGASGEE